MRSRLGTLTKTNLQLLRGTFSPLGHIVTLRGRLPGPPRTIGARTVVLGFGLLIGTGTALLSLPVARSAGTAGDILTALFTATSAACLAGLVVVETGAYWSTFGHGVILGLMQVGGLGIMTAAMLVLIIFGRSVSLQDRFTLREAAGSLRIRSVPRLIMATAALAMLVQVLGAAVLFSRLRGGDLGTWQAAWQSGFLAVSSFNNAGFDILVGPDSLAAYMRSPAILLTVVALAITGGLGVLVVFDIGGARSIRRLTAQTKVTLLMVVALLAVGSVAFFLAEYDHALNGLSPQDKLVNAFFSSSTSRSAGFSTVPPQGTREQTQLLTMVLMYIGGATGGTAGGIKVSTLALLVLATWAAVRGYDRIRLYGWEIPHGIVYRALGVAALFLMLILAGTLALTITEQTPFRDLLFEAVSALGTVGLTTGATAQLSGPGQITTMVLMFAGRVGPLVLMQFLVRGAHQPSYRLPEGRLAIG